MNLPHAPIPILLVVEDEDEFRELLVEELSALPIKILSAGDGHEAKRIVESQPVDAILSDIQMPKMSGLALLSDLRAHGRLTPVVFLTAYSDQEHTIEALRRGALDFLEKPFDQEKLFASVTRALELGVQYRGLDDELERICQTRGLSKYDLKGLQQAQIEILKMKKVSRWIGKKVS